MAARWHPLILPFLRQFLNVKKRNNNNNPTSWLRSFFRVLIFFLRLALGHSFLIRYTLTNIAILEDGYNVF